MCRLLAWAGRKPVTVEGALGEAELSAFSQLSRSHADGWGMAWWPEEPDREVEPRSERSTLPAREDPRFDAAVHGIRGDLGFVHLRWATPGLAVAPENTHPFVRGQWAFAHNGAIHPQSRLDEIVPRASHMQPHGTTDSERYFLAILARMQDGASVAVAVADVVADIFQRFEPSSLNAMLLGPDALHVIAAHDPARVPTAATRPELGDVAPDAILYDLHHRRTGDSFVVASSGFQEPDPGGWKSLPNMSILRIDRATLDVEVQTLPSSLASLAR